MSLSGSFLRHSIRGISLLEFLFSTFLLTTLIAAYLGWSSTRAAEQWQQRLVQQVEEVGRAAREYRQLRLPYVVQSADGLQSAWPDSFEDLQHSTLPPTLKSVVPGSRWRLYPTSAWGQGPGAPDGLVMRLEWPEDSTYAEQMEVIVGTIGRMHPWRRYLPLQPAADCGLAGDIACDALEIFLPSESHHYLHSTAAVAESPVKMAFGQFKSELEQKQDNGVIDLGDARLTDLADVEVAGQLQTRVLEAGQVKQCCLLSSDVAADDFGVSAHWPRSEVGLTTAGASPSIARATERRLAHRGMGYLGLGDAFVGSDALYTRVLTLGGDAGIHVDEPALHQYDSNRSESSYFSFVRLKDVRIATGRYAADRNKDHDGEHSLHPEYAVCAGNWQTQADVLAGRLIGWRPSTAGGMSYRAYQALVEQAGFLYPYPHTTGGVSRPPELNPLSAVPFATLHDAAVRASHYCTSQKAFGPTYQRRVGTSLKDFLYGWYKNCTSAEYPCAIERRNASALSVPNLRPWGGRYFAGDRADAPTQHRGLMGGLQRRSDARFKHSIRPLTADASALKSIRAYSYDKGGKPEMGFVAQEVQQHYPRLVRAGEDGYLKLRYEGMIPVLWGQLGDVAERTRARQTAIEHRLARLERLTADTQEFAAD